METLVASFIGEEGMIAEVHVRKDGKFFAGLRDSDLTTEEARNTSCGVFLGGKVYAAREAAIAYAQKLVPNTTNRET